MKIRVKIAVDFVRDSSKITGLVSEYARLLYSRFDSGPVLYSRFDSSPVLEMTLSWSSSIIFSVKKMVIQL